MRCCCFLRHLLKRVKNWYFIHRKLVSTEKKNGIINLFQINYTVLTVTPSGFKPETF